MKRFGALLGKETQAVFSSPIAYAVIAVFLVMGGYSFNSILFLNKIGTRSERRERSSSS